MRSRSSIPPARTTPASRRSAARSARSTSEPLLTLDGVSVRYNDADPPAVNNVTLAVHAGERIALIGPSGAGKSTILRLVSGLTLPTKGRVQVFAVDSAELGRRAHRGTRSRIGIVSQDFALVGPLRVASNVAAGRLGRWSWFQAVRSLLRPGPIDEIQATLDAVGIEDKLWDRADKLSGGQQQRTAIARLLFGEPDLFVVDEPVSALDPARSESVMQLLAEASAETGKAMVASMHDAELALRHCDRVIGLREGTVHFDTPASSVTPEMLHDLYVIDGEVPQ